MKDYIQEIMNADATSERNTYSFTCSSKTIEERAIIAYMDFLKDNNITYGKFLKDVLYNSAISEFNLPLPRRSSAVIIGSKTSSESGISSNDMNRLFSLLSDLSTKSDAQLKEIDSLHNIIEEQNKIIKQLLNKENNIVVEKDTTNTIAVTSVDATDVTMDETISEDELRAIKERENMQKQMEGENFSSLFPGVM